MTEQAKLYILSDFSVKEKEMPLLVHQCCQLDFSRIADHLTAHRSLFYSFPEKTSTQVTWKKRTEEGDIYLFFNGICIRISRHVIQFYVDAPFQTWVDYEAFRLLLNDFLSAFLRPFAPKQLLFLPSYWEQPFGTVKNEWHEKRLQILQEKITQEAVSFKRSLLHLRQCLGEPQQNWPPANSGACYWMLPFSDIDSGKLTVWCKLKTAVDVESFAQTTTKGISIPCHREWRNNVCPFLNYSGKQPEKMEDNDEPTLCRLVPFIGKQENLPAFIAQEGYACWNKHCFFTLELHNHFVCLTFSKPASILMHPNNRKECMRFIAHLLSHFPLQHAWLGSEESFAELGTFTTTEEIEQYLDSHYLLCQDISMISSWRQEILIL